MTGSIRQIEQNITDLEEAIAKIAYDLEQSYTQYLDVLAQAVGQQLTLATYHLCTQGYPESFLKLSFSTRQTFQQELRHLAQAAQHQLRELINLSSAQATLYTENDQNPEPANEEHLLIEAALSEQIIELDSVSLESEFIADTPSLPERLVNWQEKMDLGISQVLRALSRDVNFLIQRSGILPQKLPEKILEVVSKTEAAEAIASPPNLLNLVIETEDADHPQSSKMTRIMAIHLRLAEIEFADAPVMTGRHQIRTLVGQVSKLRREYHRRLRERAVVEAEAAWRSSWFEDESEHHGTLSS
ncbi:MAG: hypothetical protein ACRC8A_03500 [Microcoleaceae cyanobacterium]